MISRETRDKWVEQHCECGADKHGNWSESLFKEFGCNCNPSEEVTDQ